MGSIGKIFLSFVLLCSLTVLGQTTKDKVQPNKNKVVTKKLYTEKEAEKIRQEYRKNVKTIGMSPAVEKKYAKIVTDYTQKLTYINRDKTQTREAYLKNVERVMREQNSKIQKILTPDQYKKHLIIYNPFAESVRYRIEHSK